MRLLVDLQGLQGVRARPETPLAPAAMAFTLDLLRRARDELDPGSALVLLDGRFPDSVALIRAALRPYLPSESIKILQSGLSESDYVSPPLAQAAAQIRVALINSLDVDVALVMNALAPTVVCATHFSDPKFRSVLQYAPFDLLYPLDGVEDFLIFHQRRQAAILAHADRAIAASRYSPRIAGDLWRAATSLAQRPGPSLPSPPSRVDERKRLALVSPIPPSKSGIASYAAQLLPSLAEYYLIDIILDPNATPDPSIAAEYPIRSVAFFKANYAHYDRVIYQMGNSVAHIHMFDLIRDYPGVVVLHDFFLGHVLEHIDMSLLAPGEIARALYRSHGWAALQGWRYDDIPEIKWRYPMSRICVEGVEGVIVHSEFSKDLAAHWYGPDFAKKWQVAPLAHEESAGEPRAVARRALGLSDQDFLVCAFGGLGPTKLNQRLVDAWLNSPLAADRNCRLVFVGENESSHYGLMIDAQSRGSGGRIRVTGFVSGAEFARYLAACDLAVQLRAHTRGETSIAVLDCFFSGAPAIINANGSFAELPDDVALRLPDHFADEQLQDALTTLWLDPERRRALAERARAYAVARHDPAMVAERYWQVVEGFHREGVGAERRRLRAANALSAGALEGAERTALKAAAGDLRANHVKQLLVDVSYLVMLDLKTGIQRVVRSVLVALMKVTPPGYRFEPVYAKEGAPGYFYARQFFQRFLGVPGDYFADDPVRHGEGDVFLGLDLVTRFTIPNKPHLLRMRTDGVKLAFVAYDILPVRLPNCFPDEFAAEFRLWLSTICEVADQIICISNATAIEIGRYMEEAPAPRLTPLKIDWFHLGADIEASIPSIGAPKEFDALLHRLGRSRSFLMVGTVEPRKGYGQALDAFEKLWEAGEDAILVIVGKTGWSIDYLRERLESHPRLGDTLHWLPTASDEVLLKLYGAASALLAASEGEGFGLPLIEAGAAGLPIVARDLPVFREVAGDAAFYFSGDAPADLADALWGWLDLHARGLAPSSRSIKRLTWEESAAMLVKRLFDEEASPTTSPAGPQATP